MDNNKKKQANRPLAASAVVLVGTGLVMAGQPAQAAPVEVTPGTAVRQAPAQQFVRTSSRSALIVHRSGMVAGSASISAAPKFAPAKKQKKVKRKHRSRRS